MKHIPLLLFLMLLLPACGRTSSQEPESESELIRGGFSTVRHQFYGAYDDLESLVPYQSGFMLEPHALKHNERKAVLAIGYQIRHLDEWEQEEIREASGEKRGSFIHSDAFAPARMLRNRIDGIEITSDVPFNDIPAGESLCSKMELFTASAWPCLQAGKDLSFPRGGVDDAYFNAFYFNPVPDNLYPIAKRLDKLEEGDLYYMDSDHYPAYILPLETPEVKEHVFTITYYEGERAWSVEIPAVFE